MITDARVFQAEFLPQDVVHRDAEINHLSRTFRPIINGNHVEPTFLFGPTGTGKTCIARYGVKQLREEVLDLNYQYVNCWEDHSRFRALHRILEGIDDTFDIHRNSTPTDVLLDRIKNYDGAPYVVILDEVDQLEDKDLLYELYRVPEIALVFIANKELEFFAQLDSRLTSRLQTAARIRFSRYENDEVVSILRDRVQWGLHPDAVTETLLYEIADAAAGDARVAIGTLRAAARTAAQNDGGEIRTEHINDAVSEAKAEIHNQNVERLTPDQRILYEIITNRGDVGAGDLYEAYEKRAKNPRTRRMVRNYLQKMQHYNLIEAHGENRGRHYVSKS